MGNINSNTILKQENKCNDRYDEFLLCQREYGFNDLKCRSTLYFVRVDYYLKRYERCIKKLEKIRQT